MKLWNVFIHLKKYCNIQLQSSIMKKKKKNGVTDIFFVIFTSDQLLINLISFAKNLISTNDISFYGTEMQYSHTRPNRPV